jgi:hypothetical protein
VPVTGRFVTMDRILQSPPSYIAPKQKTICSLIFCNIFVYGECARWTKREVYAWGGGVRRGGVSCEVNNANLMKKSFRLLYVERDCVGKMCVSFRSLLI